MTRFEKHVSIKATPEKLGLFLNGKIDAEGRTLQAMISTLYGQEEIGVTGIGVIKPYSEYIITVEIVLPSKFSKER